MGFTPRLPREEGGKTHDVPTILLALTLSLRSGAQIQCPPCRRGHKSIVHNLGGMQTQCSPFRWERKKNRFGSLAELSCQYKWPGHPPCLVMWAGLLARLALVSRRVRL